MKITQSGFNPPPTPTRNKKMKTYNTLQELAKATRCHFAQKTAEGWVARRTSKNATHRLHYTFAHGQLDRNNVTPEAL
jgi:hypothetical protein